MRYALSCTAGSLPSSASRSLAMTSWSSAIVQQVFQVASDIERRSGCFDFALGLVLGKLLGLLRLGRGQTDTRGRLGVEGDEKPAGSLGAEQSRGSTQ